MTHNWQAHLSFYRTLAIWFTLIVWFLFCTFYHHLLSFIFCIMYAYSAKFCAIRSFVLQNAMCIFFCVSHQFFWFPQFRNHLCIMNLTMIMNIKTYYYLKYLFDLVMVANSSQHPLGLLWEFNTKNSMQKRAHHLSHFSISNSNTPFRWRLIVLC